MSKYLWYQGKVIDIIDETHNIKRFFIQIPELTNYEFQAGQFLMLDLPIESKVTTRMYSIASAPDSGNVVELIIVLNETGLGTPYLFQHIKTGSALTVSSALGKFVLPDVLDRDICFICTGVGIAPFRSMYLDIYRKNLPHQNLYMIFGTRLISDLCYYEELQELDKQQNSFHYLPTLSREPAPTWSGRKGYVHEVYKEIFKEKPPAYFFLCGWKNMIFEARDNLVALGYDRKDIRYELYD